MIRITETRLSATLMLLLLICSLFLVFNLAPARGLVFSGTSPVPMGVYLSYDPKLAFLDNAPLNGTALKTDPLIKYVDTNNNNLWDPGEPVAYDANNSSKYQVISPVIAGVITVGTTLKTDPHLKYVDINQDLKWDTGEAVVYDTNSNNVYNTGEPVIAGTPLVVGTPFASDSHFKFIGVGTSWASGNQVLYDSNNDGLYSSSNDPHLKFVDSNNNNRWDPGESVVYDTNLNNAYDSGEPVIYGPTPLTGTALKTDPNIRFVDANRNGVWDPGEAVVYDADANRVYDSADTLLLAASLTALTPLTTDNRIKFVDNFNLGHWNASQAVVFDTVGQGYYNATVDPRIKYFDANGNGVYDFGIDSVVYDKFGTGIYQTGDPVISGPTPPTVDGTLSIDRHFRFIDGPVFMGRWALRDPVVYNTRLDNIYRTGDLVIVGPAPANGTFLMEPLISGVRPTVGTPLKTDPKIKYAEIDGNNFWDLGEPVVYDTNSNNLYDTGEPVILGISPAIGTLLSEPVIAGSVPTLGALLKSDAKLKFIDVKRSGLWAPGDPVVYDINGNGLYDPTKTVIAFGAPGIGVWKSGEVVVYDTNANSVYDLSEPVVFGTAPINGTTLARDPLVRYVDANTNGHWDPGETVIYDANNDFVYDASDIVIAGFAPVTNFFKWPSVSQDSLKRTWLVWNEMLPGSGLNPIVYLKTWNGTVWSQRQAVTSGASADVQNYVISLSNRTMMILWSSNSTGHPEVFYRLYSASGNPTPTIGPVQLTSNPSLYDEYPSAVQDRNGRIWVFWARHDSFSHHGQIFYKYSNGSAWSPEFILPPASVFNLNQASPFVSQTKDGKIRVVFASNDTRDTHLYYTSTDDTLPSLPVNGIPAASWSTKTAFPFGVALVQDDRPVLVQARDGGYWLFFQRVFGNGTQNIYYANSADGVTWPATATQLTNGEDFEPAAVQLNSDHKIWIFWNRIAGSSLQIWSESSDAINGIHDVGLQNLVPSPGFVRSKWSVNITVNVVNYGDFPETPQLTLKANNTVLTTMSPSLSPGQAFQAVFNWTNAPWGRYTLSAAISPITGENPINQGDNSILFYPLKVSPVGDANGDGAVNVLDLALVAICYGRIPVPGTLCNPYVDVDRDGTRIDVIDLATVAINYGKTL